MSISDVVGICSKLMGESSENSPIERRFKQCAVIAALLSVPTVLMQISENHLVHSAGNTLHIFIWLFFVLESTVLVSLAADNWVWIRSHKLELTIVLGTAPMFSFVGEKGLAYGLVPLLLLSRVLRILRFAKLLKIGKLLKTMKIVKHDESFPNWVDHVVFGFVYVLIAGLIGMIVDKEAHSITKGIKYWFAFLNGEVEINWSHVLLWVLIISLPLIVLIAKFKKSARMS